MTLHGLTALQWQQLSRRVSTGEATVDDAALVEQLGLPPQAERIRSRIATHNDAVLIHLEAQIQLMDRAKEPT